MRLLDLWLEICALDIYLLQSEVMEFLKIFATLGPECRLWSQATCDRIRKEVRLRPLTTS